jgi:outer membrane protein
MMRIALAVALGLLLPGAPGLAQTPAPAQQPPPKPAQQPPPKPAPPAPTPTLAPPSQTAPPKPFPEGARIAYVVLQRIANESAEGKVATAKIQALQQKRAAELNEKNKTLQGLQQKLEKEASVMSTQAQGDLQKQIERTQVDIQRATQDAQQELQELQQQLQQEFTRRVEPILAQVGQEKGLHFIFNGPDSGLVWADGGLDITNEVIKKLDAEKPASPPAPKPPGQ